MTAMARFWGLCQRRPGIVMLLTMALVVLGWFMVSYFRLGDELRQSEALTRELYMALTRQMAERIDRDLRQFSMIPQTLAATLSVRADWTPDLLKQLMADMLQNDGRLYGICTAFEPGQFKEKDGFVFYVCRTKNGLEASMLDIPYRELPWYAEPKRQQHGLWTEPFFDSGVDPADTKQKFMVTYSVPITRKGFAGVATADLSSVFFDDMRAWLDENKVGRNAFVLSAAGTFLSHPRLDFRMPKKITDVPEFGETRGMKNLTQRLLSQETGSAAVVDPQTGKQITYFFAPIPSAQWMFVTVVEEQGP